MPEIVAEVVDTQVDDDLSDIMGIGTEKSTNEEGESETAAPSFEAPDLSNLLNPIGIVSVLLFGIGVWVVFKNKLLNKLLGFFGVIGIVFSEIYQFLTWHIMTITGEMNLRTSFEFAFPEFYVGLIVSLAMVVDYCVIEKKMSESEW